jgi:hypothetical protein
VEDLHAALNPAANGAAPVLTKVVPGLPPEKFTDRIQPI